MYNFFKYGFAFSCGAIATIGAIIAGRIISDNKSSKTPSEEYEEYEDCDDFADDDEDELA